jgi:hypothetical protein
MKAVSIIIGIVVLLLWFVSASYIAAPTSVQKMLPQPPMGSVPHAFLGVLIFLLSMVLIVIWAAFTKDAPEIAVTA